MKLTIDGSATSSQPGSRLEGGLVFWACTATSKVGKLLWRQVPRMIKPVSQLGSLAVC